MGTQRRETFNESDVYEYFYSDQKVKQKKARA